MHGFFSLESNIVHRLMLFWSSVSFALIRLQRSTISVWLQTAYHMPIKMTDKMQTGGRTRFASLLRSLLAHSRYLLP